MASKRQMDKLKKYHRDFEMSHNGFLILTDITRHGQKYYYSKHFHITCKETENRMSDSEFIDYDEWKVYSEIHTFIICGGRYSTPLW